MQYFENDPLNVLTLVVDRILDRNNFKKNQIIQHICTILTFQCVTKQLFWFTNYKSNIFHFALSFCSPLSFSPLPRCVSPLCLPRAVIPMQRVGVSVYENIPSWDSSDVFPGGFASIYFFNIKLPFWDIDGATPSYLPTSINQPNQNMPQSIMQRIPLWHVTLSKMVAETSTLLMIAWKWKALQGWLPNYPKNRKVEEISIKPFLDYS